MKKIIPNFITILNLLCGSVAVVFVLEGNWYWAVMLVFFAALADFLDGLAARLLKAYSEIGKQLDSLADMVSFGLLPAFMLYKIYQQLFIGDIVGIFGNHVIQWIIYATILIVPAFSAIRLARFNTDQSEESFFLGLATPANAIFWTGMYWQIMKEGVIFQHEISIWFIWIIQWILALHMILPIPMFSLKFEHFKLKGNIIRYLYLLTSGIILIFTGIPGLSVVILLYILIAMVNMLMAGFSGIKGSNS